MASLIDRIADIFKPKKDTISVETTQGNKKTGTVDFSAGNATSASTKTTQVSTPKTTPAAQVFKPAQVQTTQAAGFYTPTGSLAQRAYKRDLAIGNVSDKTPEKNDSFFSAYYKVLDDPKYSKMYTDLEKLKVGSNAKNGKDFKSQYDSGMDNLDAEIKAAKKQYGKNSDEYRALQQFKEDYTKLGSQIQANYSYKDSQKLSRQLDNTIDTVFAGYTSDPGYQQKVEKGKAIIEKNPDVAKRFNHDMKGASDKQMNLLYAVAADEDIAGARDFYDRFLNPTVSRIGALRDFSSGISSNGKVQRVFSAASGAAAGAVANSAIVGDGAQKGIDVLTGKAKALDDDVLAGDFTVQDSVDNLLRSEFAGINQADLDQYGKAAFDQMSTALPGSDWLQDADEDATDYQKQLLGYVYLASDGNEEATKGLWETIKARDSEIRQTVNGSTYGSTSQNAVKSQLYQEYLDKNKLMLGLYKSVVTTGSQLDRTLLSFIPVIGTALSLGVMGLDVYGKTYSEDILNGRAEDGKTAGHAATAALLEVAMEKLLGGLNHIPGLAIDEVSKRFVKNLANPWARGAVNTLLRLHGEGTEEALTDVANAVSTGLWFGEGNIAQRVKQGIEDDFDAQQMLESYIYGVISAFFLGGLSTAGEIHADFNYRDVGESLNTLESTDKLIDTILNTEIDEKAGKLSKKLYGEAKELAQGMKDGKLKKNDVNVGEMFANFAKSGGDVQWLTNPDTVNYNKDTLTEENLIAGATSRLAELGADTTLAADIARWAMGQAPSQEAFNKIKSDPRAAQVLQELVDPLDMEKDNALTRAVQSTTRNDTGDATYDTLVASNPGQTVVNPATQQLIKLGVELEEAQEIGGIIEKAMAGETITEDEAELISVGNAAVRSVLSEVANVELAEDATIGAVMDALNDVAAEAAKTKEQQAAVAEGAEAAAQARMATSQNTITVGGLEFTHDEFIRGYMAKGATLEEAEAAWDQRAFEGNALNGEATTAPRPVIPQNRTTAQTTAAPATAQTTAAPTVTQTTDQAATAAEAQTVEAATEPTALGPDDQFYDDWSDNDLGEENNGTTSGKQEGRNPDLAGRNPIPAATQRTAESGRTADTGGTEQSGRVAEDRQSADLRRGYTEDQVIKAFNSKQRAFMRSCLDAGFKTTKLIKGPILRQGVDKDGNPVTYEVNALVDDDGNLVIRWDNPYASPLRVALHERIHLWLGSMSDSERTAFVKAALQDIFGDNTAAFDAMYKAYADVYAKAYTGLTGDVFAAHVMEEMLADMYAGMNNYGADAGSYQSQAEMYVSQSGLREQFFGEEGGFSFDEQFSLNDPFRGDVDRSKPPETRPFPGEKSAHDGAELLSLTSMAQGANFELRLNSQGQPYELIDKKTGKRVEHVTGEMMIDTPLGNIVQLAVDNGNIDADEAAQQRDMLASAMNLIVDYDDAALVWELVGSQMFSAVKANSDKQYNKTIDFSTICKKTMAIVDAMSETMKKLGRGLTRREVEIVYEEVGKKGLATPCPVCYVFSRWMGIGGLLDQMNRFQEKYGNMSEEEIVAFMTRIEDKAYKYAKEHPKSTYFDKDAPHTRDHMLIGKVISDMKSGPNSKAASAIETLNAHQQALATIAELEKAKEKATPAMAKKYDEMIRKLRYNVIKSEEALAEVEAKMQAAEAEVEPYEEYQWLAKTMMISDSSQVNEAGESVGNWKKNPNFRPVPKDILFDLNKGGEFAKDYPLSWAFRTGKGCAAGKAIAPYSDARVGETIQGVATDVKNIRVELDESQHDSFVQDYMQKNNATREVAEEAWQNRPHNEFQTGDTKTQQKTLKTARKKQRQQNLIGGMRYQSTSDFRYEFGSDYLITFLEMQALGANVQLYTKVIEAVDFLASTGADCNLSVMPLGDGYVEVIDPKTGKVVIDPKTGKPKLKLKFSDITGINADAAIKKSQEYDNVQLILVGINDTNIRLALEGDEVTFVIPFHGSGQSVHQIQTLMDLIGEHLDVTQAQDYTSVQSDRAIKDRAEKHPELQAMWDLRMDIIMGKFLTEEQKETLKAWENATSQEEKTALADRLAELGKAQEGLSAEQKARLAQNKHLQKLYDMFYVDTTDPAFYNNLAKDQAEHIFPYEYWIKDGDYAHADENGRVFQEYCASIGVIPRFSGINSKYQKTGFGDFTQDKGYWKLLIDRSMYENVYNEKGDWIGYGKYRPQQQINMTNIDIGDLNPETGKAQFQNGEMSKQYDATRNPEDLAKRDNIVSDSIKRIEAMRGSADVVERNALDRTRVKKDFREKVMKAQSALREANQTAEPESEVVKRLSIADGEPKEETVVYIKDGYNNETGEAVDFINAILDGVKKGETRNHNSFPYKNWVGLAKGKADGKVYGRVKFGKPYQITRESPEYQDALIAGTDYDIPEGGSKWYYPVLEIEDFRDDPKPFRHIAQTGKYQRATEPASIAPAETPQERYSLALSDSGFESSNREAPVTDDRDQVLYVAPSSDAWAVARDTDGSLLNTEYIQNELGLPIYDNPHDEYAPEKRGAVIPKASDLKHKTANTSTEPSYVQAFDYLTRTGKQGARVLDASSGMGHGVEYGRSLKTEDGKPMFDVIDLEPYSGNRPVDFKHYGGLIAAIESGEEEPFDFIINNAVINVMAQDAREELLANLIRMLKPGGQLFINPAFAKEWDGYKKAIPLEEYKQRVANGEDVSKKNVIIAPSTKSTGGEIYTAQSKSIQKGYTDPEFMAFAKDVAKQALGEDIQIEKGSKLPGLNKGFVITRSNETQSGNRFSLSDEQQEKNVDYNNRQNTVGGQLKTRNGSPIKRGGTLNGVTYPIGKVIGDRLYIHKDYVDSAIQANPEFGEALERAQKKLQDTYPDFEYNCLNYQPKTGQIQFQEAPDFDTAREPVVGKQVNVEANGDISKIKSFGQIWHHKWQWVGDRHPGFAESWNWSKQWLNALKEPSKGGSLAAWNKQLDEYGLPHDGQPRFSVAPTETPQERYSMVDKQFNDWAPEFYSKMARVVDDWTNGKGQPLGAKMAANQVVGWLKGKGVKSEEIKWSGIVPYLEGKKTVTKEELQQVMAENEVKIETKVLESGKGYKFWSDEEWDNVTADSLEDLYEYGYHLAETQDFDPEEIRIYPSNDGYYITRDDTGEILVDAKRNDDGDTHWSEYVLDGGENYREILFKMPSLGGYTNQAMRVHWGEADVIAHARVQDMERDESMGKVLFVEEIQSDLHNAGTQEGFASGDGAKSLTQLRNEFVALREQINKDQRFNEISRAISDRFYDNAEHFSQDGYPISEGAKVLNSALGANLVERWMRGFIDYPARINQNGPAALDYLRAEILTEEEYKEIEGIRKLHQEFRRARDAYEEAGRNSFARSTPDVPFAGSSDTYHEFVMKHLLRLAAEGDYDAIAWTTAQQQSDRWSDEYAEGYRIEYDQNLPKFMNKYGKQWGAKVGSSTLLNGQEVWSVDITPEMKDSVLHEGQPRFSVAPTDKNPFPKGSAEQQMLDMMNKADNPDALEDYINGLIEKRNQSIEHQKEIPPALPRDTLFPVNEKQKEIAQNQLDSLIKKYGLLQKGEKAARDKSYPERTSDTQFVRRTARTAAEAAGIPEYFADQIDQAVLNELLTYTRITDKMANKKSDKEFSDLGYKKAIKEWNTNRAGTNIRPDKYDIAFGERLLIEASRNNDAAVAMKVLADLAAMATQAGQVVQAVRMLKDMGPIGQLYYVQKAVDRINKDNAGRIAKGSFQPITIDQKLAEAVVLSNTKKEMEDNMKVLIKSIADQLPVTLKDKWDAWRYLAMLGNTRTHVRNIFGNMIFVPIRFAKDMLAAAGEQFIDPSERTKSVGAKLHSAKYADVREYAEQDFKNMEPYITTGGKMNPLNEIMEARTIFKTPIIGQTIEKLRRFNDWALKGEDVIFLRSAYIDAFTQFVAARGLTAEQLTGPDGGATLNEARQYAALEAQKATYRDFSRLATALNGLRKTPGLGLLLDGLLPFTKTPVNILKRGIEYSPAGLAKGAYDALFKVRRGDITAAQAVDEMAAGLTGTGVAILGYILASMGLARGADDDDKKKQELEEAQGHQSYSLEIGDNSYTIDWAAPVALPFFVGVEAHKQLVGDGEGSFWDFCNAMTLLMEPMMSLSMLDGINSTLTAVKSDQNSPIWAVLSNILASYVSQGAPTIGGQFARTFDPDRRSTYVDKNIEGPALLQRTLQGIQGKVPGLAKEKMAYVDVWGRKDTSSSALWRAFENFASPGYGNKIKETPVDTELMRLYDATGDNSVLPSTVAKYFQVEGERLDLTAKQYEKYKTTTGQTAFKLIGELIDDPVYGSMSDAQKAETVKQLLDAAVIIGKQEVAPNYKGTAWVERAVAQDNLETAAVFHTIKAQNTGLSSYQLIESMAWLTPEEQGKLIMSERSNTERKMTDYTKKKYKFILTDEQIAREREIYNGMFWPAYNELIYSPKFLSADVATRSAMISKIQENLNKAARMQLGDELRAEGYTSVLEDDSDVPEQPVDLYSLLNRG